MMSKAYHRPRRPRLLRLPLAHTHYGRRSAVQLFFTKGLLLMWMVHLPCCRLPPQGLLRLNTTSGQLEQLASRVAGDNSTIAYANGLDIAANGSVFFTASTDILPARSRDGSYDTGFAWALNNFRGLARCACDAMTPAMVAAAASGHVVRQIDLVLATR